MNAFSSAAYWEARYAAGHHSGAGSRGALAAWKAAVVNGFVAANGISRVLDLGCGDGHLLSLLLVPDYTGVDVSPTVLADCAARHGHRPECRFLAWDDLDEAKRPELILSLDVIYHLIEDAVFEAYLDRLFALSSAYALIYASDVDGAWPAAHVRHRRFSARAAAHAGWRRVAVLPNPRPFDPARPDETSFADFHVYARDGLTPCIRVPAP